MMKRSRLAAFALPLFLTQSLAVCQTTASEVYYVDLGFGLYLELSRLSGPSVRLTGFTNVHSIAFSPNGVLYGTGRQAGDPYLLTIEKSTGAAAPVARITGTPPGADCSLAFRQDGTLYASCGGTLYMLDPASGAGSLRPMPAGVVGACAFGRDPWLYSVVGGTLYTLDLSRGGIRSATSLPTDYIVSLTFDPATDQFYAIESCLPPSIGIYHSIVTIDAAGHFARVTPQGRLPMLVSIASRLHEETSAIPTLSPGAMSILVVLLTTTTLFLSKKGRVAA